MRWHRHSCLCLEFVHFVTRELARLKPPPGANAPPLLIQEGSFNGSPPQMRRGGALGDGVVLKTKVELKTNG